MRPYIVFAILLLMMGGLVFLLVTRERPPHRMPEASSAETSDDGGASTADGAPGDAGVEGDGGVAATDGGGGQSADAAAAVADGDVTPPAADADGAALANLDRPIRVVGLGWELLAPGLVANRGSAPGSGSRFAAEGLDVRIAAVGTAQDAERALARGGAEEGGADVAILPLPAFVAAGERLRALAPQIFMVVGWSHGQETLFASREDALSSLPASGEVQVATEEGSAAAFLALFVLDLAGVSPSRVQLVAVREEGSASAPFVAVEAGGAMPPDDGERHRLLTTTEATGLIPYVAVAPRGFIDSHGEAVAAITRAWQAGLAELDADVPAAARRIAALSGAPEALVLLERLGRIEASSGEGSRRRLATLEGLYRHTHGVLRDAHALSSPAPEVAPLHRATLGGSGGEEPAPRETAGGDGGAADAGSQPPPREVAPILVWHPSGSAADEDQVVSTAGLIATVFSPLSVRITVRGPRARTDQAVAATTERFGLEPSRVEAGRQVVGAGPASVELLPAP